MKLARDCRACCSQASASPAVGTRAATKIVFTWRQAKLLGRFSGGPSLTETLGPRSGRKLFPPAEARPHPGS